MSLMLKAAQSKTHLLVTDLLLDLKLCQKFITRYQIQFWSQTKSGGKYLLLRYSPLTSSVVVDQARVSPAVAAMLTVTWLSWVCPGCSPPPPCTQCYIWCWPWCHAPHWPARPPETLLPGAAIAGVHVPLRPSHRALPDNEKRKYYPETWVAWIERVVWLLGNKMESHVSCCSS